MWLLAVNIFIIFLGIFVFALAKILPLFQLVYFDYIGVGVVASASIFTLYRLFVTRCYLQADKPAKWKILINYMRRDNVTIPIQGQRAYPGESFLDVPQLGLVEFLGRDTYYQWGDKKYVWGLENINFTPDPRYSNMCNTLWELGVKNSDDLIRVLNIDKIPTVTEHDLYVMGKMFIGMEQWNDNHGSNRLLTELKTYDGPTVNFKPKSNKFIQNIGEKVDDILSNNPYRK